MSHNHKIIHHPYCLNCHYPLSEFDKNCSQCGQRPTDGKISLHDLLHEFVHTLFHVDGKLFWTLKHLFIPSKLTIEFFKGHHKRYAHPVQLFLVLGALAFGVLNSVAYKAEEQFAQSLERNKKAVIRNKFLMELDSVSKNVFSNAKANTTTRDTLMWKMIFPQGLDTSEANLRNRMKKIVDEQLTKNRSRLSYEFAHDDEAMSAFKDSLIEVITNENDDIDEASINKMVDSSVSNIRIGNMAQGFESTIEEVTLAETKAKMKSEIRKSNTLRNIKEAIKIKEDSTNIFTLSNFSSNTSKKNLRIPTREIYDLTPDSIMQKYEIHGFLDKIQTKQIIKIQKEGNNFLHYFMSKLFIMTFALIPVLAAFFTLIYRKQKRYYIEHIVFLMHYNTALFLGITFCLLIAPYWSTILPLFFLWMTIHFYLSLKWYYQQGWRKTFVKFSIITLIYLIMAMLFLISTAIIGFILF